MSFSTFKLNSQLLSALPEKVTKPSRIQDLVIEAIIAAKDVLALAQTGSGKTYAYGLPVLHRLSLMPAAQLQKQGPMALVIVPTRELATQIGQDLSPLAHKVGLTLDVLCGGEAIEQQINRLSSKVHMIVATPGRLLALVEQGFIRFEHVQSVVLDEADRLLDMGFIKEINVLLKRMPNKQTLLFSATLPDALDALAGQVLATGHVRVEAHAVNSAVDDIEQTLYLVNKGSKAKVLMHLMNLHQWSQVLVFVNAKDNADALCKKLRKAGIDCAALHGDKNQVDRSQSLADFKTGQLSVLVVTDVLARGIHIDALPVVINFELPHQAAVYVHRIGRTARAGQSGIALSLVSHSEIQHLDAIRLLTQQPLTLKTLEAFPVTDKPSCNTSKRPPRDKQANRRTASKRSSRDFSSASRNKSSI
ncbi:DEAD/DEAH box helicase [Shewanella aestuarii]|uniref:DEAD/DEAH box helicase n=1 Tax=Shewanella aestuarii TaxID=1028752 RepID=A0A6G9QNC1_9GAMM|nr:DEAD/DEAH box helicase [Shewanella aestuarii]QIR15321.1 DEAD/DEAH box helicase [Shewanella aestuarii]